MTVLDTLIVCALNGLENVYVYVIKLNNHIFQTKNLMHY